VVMCGDGGDGGGGDDDESLMMLKVARLHHLGSVVMTNRHVRAP
jgi:hypothetical protein